MNRSTGEPDAGRRRTVGRTLFGLLCGLLVAMLATSIVSTSLPRIVDDLGGSQTSFTWIVTATLLAITVSTPIWGKLADLMSRRALVMAALALFIVGSVVCGFAPEPVTLIAGRTLQGLGAGGLLSLVQIVLADIISPRDRGKYMGLLGAVTAIGTIGGPLLGGLVTDLAGWRWNFLGSAAIAAVSLVIVLLTLPSTTGQGRRRVDYVGALLITAGFTGLLLWVSFGGVQFPWLSWTSAMILGATVVLLLAAIAVEARVQEPIIPLELFRNRAYVLAVLASVAVGVATYGVAIFMSQYLQVSRDASPTQSSLITMPQLIAVTLASTVIGALVSRYGHWKRWMVGGAACQATGLLLLGTITVSTPVPLLWGYLALVGIGIGSVMQNLVLVAENSVDPRKLGVATSGVAFFRTLGGTVGVAGLGAIVTWRVGVLAPEAADAAGVDLAGLNLQRLTDAGPLPDPVQSIIEGAYARAIGDTYLVCGVLATAAVLCILLLPSEPLSTKTRAERIEDAERETAIAIAGGDPDAAAEAQPTAAESGPVQTRRQWKPIAKPASE
ncbi:EmrB/QacA subfamily drug resistance transporter [Microbacterium trichothecenolyticum]|uniref:MFS transporter n=1 Tax=Microbacterium trichothecenolyticum TaxID=69370 RepID=UPI0028611C3C|nr:MFS transporter [Microbacterium trichothecenolyticum]MDR7113710.1 EmrB/QacA subfamily drug resistance transporter [Microbacterium trichothecenolyticum]